MKKVLLGLALVAVAVLAAGAFYLYSQKQGEDREADEAAAAQVVAELTAEINSVLQKTTPVSWVYDADDTVLFAIRVSDEASATQSVPSPVVQGLREMYPEGFAGVIFSQLMSTGKYQSGSDYFVDCAIKALTGAVSETDMMRYLTTIAVYGKVTGLENAATTYFNRDLAHLNSWQYAFLVYAYNNPNATTTDYLTSIGKTADQVDFFQDKVRNSALEALLRSEVQKIPEVQIGTESYTIKLALSLAQQQAVQSSVDSYLRSQIELSSNGSYVINASVAVMNNATGLITVYVPGRTATTANAKEFAMNTDVWSDNFTALISRIARPGQTRYSLQAVKLPNGDTTFVGTDQQWREQQLATGVSDTGTAVDILKKIKVMVLSSEPSLVQQVKSLSGTVVYEATAPVIQPSNNVTVLKLRQCFAEEGVDSTVTLGSSLQISSGIVSFEMTRDYTVVVLLGSGVIGKEISSETKSSLVGIAASIIKDVKAFFPTPRAAMFARTQEIAEEFATTYEANYALLAEGLGEKFEALRLMPIVSFDTRRAFESEYERLSAELKSLESFVSRESYATLNQDLYEIRQERAEAILKYSV